MADLGPAEKIKADDIAGVFRAEIRASVDALKAKGIQPTLVGFLGLSRPSSTLGDVYSKF